MKKWAPTHKRFRAYTLYTLSVLLCLGVSLSAYSAASSKNSLRDGFSNAPKPATETPASLPWGAWKSGVVGAQIAIRGKHSPFHLAYLPPERFLGLSLISRYSSHNLSTNFHLLISSFPSHDRAPPRLS